MAQDPDSLKSEVWRPESDDRNAAEWPTISLHNLSKHYGRLRAVRDLTLEVERGEVFGFLGLNGAGKTTTIRVLLDLLRPTSGQARLFGFDCHRESGRTRALVGYLPGELGLYPDMTGEETLELLADLSGTEVRPEYQRELLDRMQLSRSELQRRLREYSTGMKRKLGLVQALQADPPLLILDEPTEGLDPLMQRELNALLLELRGKGRTVFMSSHVLSEVERVCDRIGVIRAGELVLLATVEEARRLGGRSVRVFFSAPVAAIDPPASATLVESTDTFWHLRVEGETGELVRRLEGLPVRDVEVVEPALEDVLQRFYREEPS